MNAIVRQLQESDHDQWRKLWDGYLTFYKTVLATQQTELTWQRLLEPNFVIDGLVAEVDGRVVGFAHYSRTNSTWSASGDIYLEDLFVDTEVRGQGLGRKLILALSDLAKSEGARKVYWQTHQGNATARKLYDSVGQLSEFVIYTRPAS
jgi:GNAT superfamily N-acetyltransferase